MRFAVFASFEKESIIECTWTEDQCAAALFFQSLDEFV